MNTQETVPSQTYRTCLVTIVEPGLPNAVIRIYPAEHESEKIFLDCRPGLERKAALMSMLERFSPRGVYVPKPAYLHAPTSNIQEANSNPLRPEDYPVAKLEGAVFQPLPPKDRVRAPQPANDLRNAQQDVAELKNQVTQLSQSLAQLAAVLTSNARPVAAPAPMPAQAPVPAAVPQFPDRFPLSIPAPDEVEHVAKRGRGRPRKDV